MAIETNNSSTGLFGTTRRPFAQQQAPANERPKANFWLNIGYMVQLQVEVDGKVQTEDKFVSLPTGIPLDTMEKVSTQSSNTEYAAFQSARNDLLDQIMDVAKTLEPGEQKIVGGSEGGLAIQVRRVSDERAPIAADSNPFVMKVALA